MKAAKKTDHAPMYIFDGSFAGLLTAVFESYERKHRLVRLVKSENYMPGIFGEGLEIFSDPQKALRVWNGLGKKVSAASLKNYYGAYLSETREVYQQLFNYAQYVFDHPKGHDLNYGNSDVLDIAQTARKVHRERHRMEAFVRFKKSESGLYLAVVSPDFNVLPLLVRHFANRYADQRWLIYDERRKYGIFYDLKEVKEVTLDLRREPALAERSAVVLDDNEQLYAILWKDYFGSTNIKERKNMKLHLRHVPKRYWRYLTEKQLDVP